MAKLILKHDDGTEEILRDYQPDDGYIAMKLWSWDDVMSVIEQHPEATEDTEKFIDINMFKSLDECTDNEWDIINYAVDLAIRREHEVKKRGSL